MHGLVRPPAGPLARPARSAPRPPTGRPPRRVVVRAALPRGREFDAEQLAVKRAMGEGAYGCVFEARARVDGRARSRAALAATCDVACIASPRCEPTEGSPLVGGRLRARAAPGLAAGVGSRRGGGRPRATPARPRLAARPLASPPPPPKGLPGHGRPRARARRAQAGQALRRGEPLPGRPAPPRLRALARAARGPSPPPRCRPRAPIAPLKPRPSSKPFPNTFVLEPRARKRWWRWSTCST
jgi:hypothetical protein